MLRNLPNNYTRDMMLRLLDGEGFYGSYDLFYLPMDFKSGVSLGYAFINMCSVEAAQRIWRLFDGYSQWSIPSRKQSGVSWSSVQGLAANVERYQRSAVMAKHLPEKFKPVLCVNGQRAPFPSLRANPRQGKRTLAEGSRRH